MPARHSSHSSSSAAHSAARSSTPTYATPTFAHSSTAYTDKISRASKLLKSKLSATSRVHKSPLRRAPYSAGDQTFSHISSSPTSSDGFTEACRRAAADAVSDINSSVSSASVGRNLPNVSLQELLQHSLGDFSLTFMQNGEPVTVGRLAGSPADLPVSRASTVLNSAPHPPSSFDELEEEMSPDSPKNRRLFGLGISGVDYPTYDQPVVELPALGSPLQERYVKREPSPITSELSQPPIQPVGQPVDQPVDPPIYTPTQHSTPIRDQSAIDPALLTHDIKPLKLEGLVEATNSNPQPSQRQLTRATQNLRLSQRKESVKRLLDMNFTAWRIVMTGRLSAAIETLYSTLSRRKSAELKVLATQLIAACYPQRRMSFPYSSGVAPLGMWPLGVPYVDPSHILAHERLALVIWLILHPGHPEETIYNMTETFYNEMARPLNALVGIARRMLYESMVDPRGFLENYKYSSGL